MNKKFVVRLTSEERGFLSGLTTKGKASAFKMKHAHILLKADAEGPAWTDCAISEAFECSLNTVTNLRQRFVEAGLEGALDRKPQSRLSRSLILDGEAEARLIALCCGKPPEGRASWALRFLADQLVTLDIIDTISHETVRQTLKKNELKPHLRKCWVIPPEKNADFVAHMEDVLDIYKRPYDQSYPVICMDEQPVQFIRETRTSLPPRPGLVERYDFEYERAGTANNFMFTEPIGGWRKVKIRARKTGVDWAEEIKELLDVDYPNAKKVILVCDNLNTHRFASLYERYAPEEARRLISRLEMHHTPKHGSWLNIAEIELSVLTKQCLKRYIPDLSTLQSEVRAWSEKRNQQQKGVDWQFTTEDARIKLKRLYPQYKLDTTKIH